MIWIEIVAGMAFLYIIGIFFKVTIIDKHNFSKKEKAYALGTILAYTPSGPTIPCSYDYSFVVDGILYSSHFSLNNFPKNNLKNKNHIGDQFIVFYAKDNPRFSKMKVFLFDGEPLNEYKLVQPPLGWQSLEEIHIPLKINPYYIPENRITWRKIKEEFKNAKATAKKENDEIYSGWNDFDELVSVKRRKKSEKN